MGAQAPAGKSRRCGGKGLFTTGRDQRKGANIEKLENLRNIMLPAFGREFVVRAFSKGKIHCKMHGEGLLRASMNLENR